MFPREWRLTRQRDLDKIYRLGQKTAGNFLLIRALPNRLNHPRLAVVIGRKINKKAVVRNRLKRLVRQAVRELTNNGALPTPKWGRDGIITIHHDPQPPYSLDRIKSEVEQCFAKLP